MEFIDLKAQYRALKPEIDANIQAVLDAGQFIGGPYVKELERQLAEYVGRKHCISCGNGTDALQAAYMALGVGEGDAVFCPDCTFIASVEPANMLGATPSVLRRVHGQLQLGPREPGASDPGSALGGEAEAPRGGGG